MNRPLLPEPSRALTGITPEQLAEIERSLPTGARVHLYPAGDSWLRAAILNSNLDGRGSAELIVLHTARAPTSNEGTLPLTLSVLSRAEGVLSVRASVDFSGGVLFPIDLDRRRTTLAARDLTGDGRPEIILAPAMGASLGGEILILSLDDSTLRELARADGHFFRVRSAGGRPALYARSRYEQRFVRYRWNGRRFE